MVNNQMTETLAHHLIEGGQVFIQTDISFLAAEMFEMFRENDKFEEMEVDENPFPVKTEREKAVEENDLNVYRKSFLKKKANG